ncbi:MAG: ATP-binding protein [Nanoarchaeota archaeon]
MIKRKIENKLLKLFKRKEILALVGSRQVGKTTLMNWLYNTINIDGKKIISFEKYEILSLFENDLDSFIELYIKNNKYLFIDEFQYAKNGGKKLKRIYDEFKIKIIISGSSVPELSIQSLQFLVGRVLIIQINQISFEEYINYKDKKLLNLYNKGISKESFLLFKNYFEEYLIFGGYPEVVLEKDNEIKKEILKSLINTYLLKEIKDILSYKDSFEFEKILEILSINLGSILNKTNLSNTLGISRYKFDEIISVLQKTYIIQLLKPLSNSKIKEIIKSPKIYFKDNGFRNLLINNFNKLNIRNDKGFIYENFVLNEINNHNLKAHFYKYRNGAEIDFIINNIAFEIKSSLNNMNIEKSFSGFIEKIKPKKIYVLNEKIFGERTIKNTKIIFTHIINIKHILNKEF